MRRAILITAAIAGALAAGFVAPFCGVSPGSEVIVLPPGSSITSVGGNVSVSSAPVPQPVECTTMPAGTGRYGVMCYVRTAGHVLLHCVGDAQLAAAIKIPSCADMFKAYDKNP